MSSYVEYHRFKRSETCTEEGCRARKWYIEDGRKFCQRGHAQAGFTQTQQDEDDWNIKQGKRSRRKGVEKKEVQTVFSGREATELYLQCYQLVLWKQCFWLVSVKGFPRELETVVRDLWGLMLKVLQPDAEDGYVSGTTGFSSTSEGGDTDYSDGVSLASRRSRRSVREKHKLPKLIETLALCYLGTLLMRLPTSLGEVCKWVTRDDMIFSRAITEVPKEMRVRLPGHYHSALATRAPLNNESLHSTVLKLVEFYHLQYEMVFPPLNSPLLIFKHVRNLGLPIEIYPAVRRLAAMLDISFSYPVLRKKNSGAVTDPTMQLISLVVVATKLSHPFDDIVRLPEDESDPTTLKMDWTKWQDAMIEQSPEGLKRGAEIDVTDNDVLAMDEKGMDDYLDWYQRTWIDGSESKMAPNILEHFPLQELPARKPEEPDHEQYAARLKQVQNGLVLQAPQPFQDEEEADEALHRPGELYRRYRSIEELPDNAKAFYEFAAAEAGTSLDRLVRGVFRTELVLENWILEARRRRMSEGV